MAVVRALQAMLAGMTPVLTEGRWCFCPIPAPEAAPLMPHALAMFREAEGLSLILPAGMAPDGQVMRQITLSVYSALDGVGLTAVVASALAAEGLSCNMVAAFHHDHAFVPEAQAPAALACLLRLQAEAQTP